MASRFRSDHNKWEDWTKERKTTANTNNKTTKSESGHKKPCEIQLIILMAMLFFPYKQEVHKHWLVDNLIVLCVEIIEI